LTVEDDLSPVSSLADDPRFLASLDDLDRGLVDESRAPAAPDRTQAVKPAIRAQLAPIAEQTAPASSPRPARPARETPPPAGPAPRVAGAPRRPLLELFPPPSAARAATPRTRVARTVPRRPDTVVEERVTYETFYGLEQKPFGSSCDPAFLYHAASHDAAIQDLLSAIRHRQGVVVLTGPAGVGKTIVCRTVLEQLDRRTVTSFVDRPVDSTEDFLKAALVDFGVMSPDDVSADRIAGASAADLVAALRDFLLTLAPLDAFALVIVDQAQRLPSEVLTQIAQLADLDAGERLLQIVLVGRPSLTRMLRRGDLRALDERVAVRCAIAPLAPDEIAGYVAHRLAVAGRNPRVEFDEEAIARVYALTGGLPRAVNLVCDRALTAGYAAAASVIDERLVGDAERELDIEPLESREAFVARVAAAVVALVLLVFAGAGGAAYVFRGRLADAAERWERIPAAPASPGLRLPPPFTAPPADELQQ
jgi:type II secretory pathway predicted ATPase ExeA